MAVVALRTAAWCGDRPLVIVDDPADPGRAAAAGGPASPGRGRHPSGAVRVLVATGTHGPPRPEALAAKLGPDDRPGAWTEVLARIDAEQGHRPGIEVAVDPCAPLQVLQPAGSPTTPGPAT